MTNNRLSFKRRRDGESQQSTKKSYYEKRSKKSEVQRREDSWDVDHSENIVVDESMPMPDRNAILVPQPTSATKNTSSNCECTYHTFFASEEVFDFNIAIYSIQSRSSASSCGNNKKDSKGKCSKSDSNGYQSHREQVKLCRVLRTLGLR